MKFAWYQQRLLKLNGHSDSEKLFFTTIAAFYLSPRGVTILSGQCRITAQTKVFLESVSLHRIMEAKSGQWIRNIYLKSIASHLDLSRTAFLVRLNSTFMVTVTEQPHPEWESTLHVYDLEAIRNPRSTECLLTTITVRYCKHDGRPWLIAIIH